MNKKLVILGWALISGVILSQAQGSSNAQYKNADPQELVNRKDLSMEQLEGIQRYFRYELKNEQKAAALEQLLVQKEPKGAFARITAFHHSTGAKTTEAQVQSCENFLKDFPLEEWNGNPPGQAFIYYSTYRVLGESYFATRQFQKLQATCVRLDFKTENEIYRWNLMRAYVFKTVGYDTLYTLSTALINDLLVKVNDSSYIENGVFNAEQARDNAWQQLDNELTTHIQLLYSLGKYQEAKGYYSHLSAKGRYASADLNQLYLGILEKLGEQAAIRPFLEKCVAANAVTPAMFTALKNCYQAMHHTLDGYDAYVAALHSADEQEGLKTYVKEHLTNKEYQPFALENAKGQLVRSSEWGDKIVVLDFWATWCRPCIEGFPGMQLVIDKYSKDDGVAVYFIGTMQYGDYKTKSVDYVKSQGYRGFNLLHDAVNKNTGQQDVVFQSFVPFFQSSAIPRKVILKDGVMRYTSEGYSGSPSKLADEISYVIELLKAEK